jgi:hypothetical protein
VANLHGPAVRISFCLEGREAWAEDLSPTYHIGMAERQGDDAVGETPKTLSHSINVLERRSVIWSIYEDAFS